MQNVVCRDRKYRRTAHWPGLARDFGKKGQVTNAVLLPLSTFPSPLNSLPPTCKVAELFASLGGRQSRGYLLRKVPLAALAKKDSEHFLNFGRWSNGAPIVPGHFYPSLFRTPGAWVAFHN